MNVDAHSQIILDRYADRANVTFSQMPYDVLVARYLSKVMSPDDIADKTILEIGAGCSQYSAYFLDRGCKRYFANDIVPERIEAVRIDDPRFVALPGDFRDIEVPEPVDIVFAGLTMMFLVPMHDEFIARFAKVLKPGGHFFSMDANYFCPLSVWRRFADRRSNPARLFSPFAYADRFRQNGFAVEKLVPFTAPLPWSTGNWLAGTTFWLRARRT
ncbi:class I SAM-dependent methyltransferase [Rhodomicrobium lacus]|uniref:class I SAM-dependent methyltransferase n=1 Tax=Rhodomicrobium TaxID=1068 RepID=UPI000F8E645A|nr:methyltransferase domain-containing protein [Rhodomicrobium lacus]WKW51464.1 methyltransferase domain-containing protein [Rhodomicrobium lacus]